MVRTDTTPEKPVGLVRRLRPLGPPRPKPPRAVHYHVYVVQLSDEVWNYAKFRRCNPGYDLGQPLVYIGMTGLDPDVRFDKHKAGIQANSYVQKYGLQLLPQLYEKLNPMGYQEAKSMEVELGIALRARGFGVWQA